MRLGIACVLATALASPARAQDIAGTWNTDVGSWPVPGPRRLAIGASGGVLRVRFESLPFGVGTTGTYDPVTRHLLAGDQTFRGGKSTKECGRHRVDGTCPRTGRP
jgi:hypothetical protein